MNMEFVMYNNNLYLTILYILTLVVNITHTQDVYGESWNDKYNRCPRLYPKKFVGYAPRGNLTAGNYTEKTDLKGIKQCVTGCCESDLCNVVFLHDTTCYHIECVTNELCLPLLRNESPSLGLHVSMVLVNPVLADESWAEVLEQANFRSELASSLQEEIYNNLANRRPELAENTLGYMKYDNPSANNLLSHFVESGSIDPESLSNDDFHYLEAKGDQVMEGSTFMPKKVYPCEVGVIIDCPTNEECISVRTKSRSGLCQCKDGFRRNPTGLCITDSMLETVPYAAVISTSKKDVEQAESMARAGSAESKAMNLKAVETSTENNVKKLTVSAISKEVRLPENEVSLSAYTIPDEKMTNDHYSYVWTLVDQPKGGFTGNMKQNGGTVKLSQLTEGSYSFKVAVNGSNSYGEGFANVTVLPVKRINQPPVVVITPASQTVKLPNTGAVLDGSASKDDDAIISWHWELTSGPLGYQPPLHDGPTLQLADLRQPGNYSFRLTVEDSDHIKNSTTANITVLNHTDYPPEANAGQDVIIYLPKNNLTLNGSLSSDDHEIATWEWTKSAEDQTKAVDMQNTHSPYLQLSNLSEGVYTFVLKVTDSSGQSSTADVHVFVKPPTNTPPKAVAGPDQFIPLPQTWAILNASGSSDDHRIVAFTWVFVKGPANVTILQFNESVANATQLTKGEYTFQLTVLDDNGNSAYDSMMVTVTQNKNAPPKADAGGDQVISLPVSVMVLNGSRSSDDFRIVSWHWARDPSGLAVGTVVADSDKQPVLMLTDVVPGRYVFSLTVTDDQGASDTDTVSIQVKADPNERSLLEMTLDAPVQSFTQGQLDSLRQKLTLLLRQGLEMNVTQVRAEIDTGRTQIVFFLFDKATSSPVAGLDALSAVRGALRSGGDALVGGVRGVRTSRCQDTCSGRGVCDQATRACLCDAFWMQNLFTPLMLDAESNCDWSVVYASLGALCVAASLGCVCWAASRGARRLCARAPPAPPRRPARLARYQLLGASDHEDKPFASNKISESDTDSDVLFESRSKTSSLTSRILNGDLPPVNNHAAKNGHRNGYMKSGRRIKT